MRHKKNKQSKGFAYVTLVDAGDIPSIMNQTHYVEDRKVDCQVAVSKREKQKKKDDQKERMIYVANLPSDLKSEELRGHFVHFGPVRNAYIIFDNETKESKRFGYVEFVDPETAKLVSGAELLINDYRVQCLEYLGRKEKKSRQTEQSSFGEYSAVNLRDLDPYGNYFEQQHNYDCNASQEQDGQYHEGDYYSQQPLENLSPHTPQHSSDISSLEDSSNYRFNLRPIIYKYYRLSLTDSSTGLSNSYCCRDYLGMQYGMNSAARTSLDPNLERK
jgi:RNA recognition motif-containing protein